MKWIKASERLPEKKTDNLDDDKGVVFYNEARCSVLLIFLSVTPNLKFLGDNLEIWKWLDETESPKEGAEEGELIKGIRDKWIYNTPLLPLPEVVDAAMTEYASIKCAEKGKRIAELEGSIRASERFRAEDGLTASKRIAELEKVCEELNKACEQYSEEGRQMAKEADYEIDELKKENERLRGLVKDNKFHFAREIIFNLRSCHAISEKVYLHWIDKLIKEEQQFKANNNL